MRNRAAHPRSFDKAQDRFHPGPAPLPATAALLNSCEGVALDAEAEAA